MTLLTEVNRKLSVNNAEIYRALRDLAQRGNGEWHSFKAKFEGNEYVTQLLEEAEITDEQRQAKITETQARYADDIRSSLSGGAGVAAAAVSVEAFPDVYPEEVQGYCAAVARSMGCSADFPKVGVLPILGAAIGSGVFLQVTPTYFERPSFWAVLVGGSGVMKSPPINAVAKPMWAYDRTLEIQNRLNYETWAEEPPRDRGPKPVERHAVTSKGTIEGIQQVLLNNPLGVLYVTGELLGWVNSMGEYKGGKGADRQLWLEIYSGSPIKNILKGAELNATIPNPFVNMLGGVQPDVLSKLTRGGDGLHARFIYAIGQYVESQGLLVPEVGEDHYFSVWDSTVERLLKIRRDYPNGLRLVLSKDAKKIASPWVMQQDNVVCRCSDKSEEWQEVCRKIKSVAFRTAVVLWGLEFSGTGLFEITGDQMKRAIEVAEWSKLSAEVALDLVDPSNDSERDYAEKMEYLIRFSEKHRGNPEMISNPKRFIKNHAAKWTRDDKLLNRILGDMGLML